MKTPIKLALALLAIGSAATWLIAQDGPPPGGRPDHPDGPPGHGHRPPPPIIAVLDANHDGVIDADEIANASAALKKLDKNGDGKLTFEELHPPRPEGDEGPGPDGPDGDRPLPPPPGDR